MGQATGLSPDAQLDTVITNALIIDYTGHIDCEIVLLHEILPPWYTNVVVHTGIYKADVGIKNGLIAGTAP